MQTVALPNQPASYTWFDANQEYQNAYRTTEPTPVPMLHALPKSNVSSNPGGSTVIQTETPTKHTGGFLGKVENVAHRVGERVGFGTNTATRWSLYQIPEPLFGEYPSKVVNGVQGYVGGFLFVSQNHLCYSSYTDKMNRAIKIAIPFANIQHIGLATRVKGTSGSAIVLTPLTALSQKPNALQIVTRDNVNHQFFGFKKNTEAVFNLLNHSWQTSRGITNPQQQQLGLGTAGISSGIQYAGQPGLQGQGYGSNSAYPEAQRELGAQQNLAGGNYGNQQNLAGGNYGNQQNLAGGNFDNQQNLAGGNYGNQQNLSGNYTTTGLVNSYSAGGLQGSDQFVNGTTSLNPAEQKIVYPNGQSAPLNPGNQSYSTM